MSIKKLVASVSLSLVLVGGIAEVVMAAVVTASPDVCKEIGGRSLPGKDGKLSNRCELSNN